MRQHIEDRLAEEATYMIETKCTLRQLANRFQISKSTAHKDISARLPITDNLLYRQCKIILDCNRAERHLRGGKATSQKYALLRQTHQNL